MPGACTKFRLVRRRGPRDGSGCLRIDWRRGDRTAQRGRIPGRRDRFRSGIRLPRRPRSARLVLPRGPPRGRVYRPAAWPLPRRRRRSIRRPRPAAGTCWDAVRGVRSIRPPLLRAHWRWATGCASSPSGARLSTWAGANEWFAGRQGGSAEPAAGRRPARLAAPRRIPGRPSGPPGGSLGQSSAR